MPSSGRAYLAENVFDAALRRIRRIFDEFPEVIVDFSGGKDSTVTLNLVLRVAEELDRLPVKVLWLDQEAEWQNVVDYVRMVMNDPRVEPLWFQGPFKLFNATSHVEPWLYCWQEGANWLRPKEPNSIHTNECGTDRFGELFSAFSRHYFGHTRCAHIAGVRAEESPGRLKGLTAHATYKDITWGNKVGSSIGHYTFYPLYDWSWSDIWKAIYEHEWPYCRLYDFMFQYGVPIHKMRVSNVHHETAIHSLHYMQEIEPHTWSAVTDRVSGVNAVNQAGDAYRVPDELPYMFVSWKEYRDYLLDNLIEDAAIHAIFKRKFELLDSNFVPELDDKVAKVCIAALLVNDYHDTKFQTFKAAHSQYAIGAGTRADRFSLGGSHDRS